MKSETQEPKTRLLILGMCNSIHFARWLEHLDASQLDIFVFNASPGRRVHERVKALMSKPQFNWVPSKEKVGFPSFLLQRFSVLNPMSRKLARDIRVITPDFIHAVEMRVAGYLLLPIVDSLGAINGKGRRTPQLIVTSYGSELHWFSKKKLHQIRIKKLLAITTKLTTECIRDASIAATLGYRGNVSSFPATGGLSRGSLYELEYRPSARSRAVVKGYLGKWGKANTALGFVRKLHQRLPNQIKEIVVYSADFRLMPFIWMHRCLSRLPVTVMKRGQLTHSEMLDLFATAAVYVGFSKTDGISTSMLEAMSQGAIPIQTNTACTEEWFKSGVSGVSAEIENLNPCLELAVELMSDEDRLRKAVAINLSTVAERYDYLQIQAKVRAIYSRKS